MAAGAVGRAGDASCGAHRRRASGRVRPGWRRACARARYVRVLSRCCALGQRVSRVRAWLDTTPLAALARTLMREATGQAEPLVAIVPTRPRRLAVHARVGLWSMAAGAGTTTLAALVAQRSAAGGHAPLLLDLDRWAPSLA